MVRGGIPETFLAPSIKLRADLGNFIVHGQRLSEPDGTLTEQGLCAFWGKFSPFELLRHKEQLLSDD